MTFFGGKKKPPWGTGNVLQQDPEVQDPCGTKRGKVQQRRLEPTGSVLSAELLPGACPTVDRARDHRKVDVGNVPMVLKQRT